MAVAEPIGVEATVGSPHKHFWGLPRKYCSRFAQKMQHFTDFRKADCHTPRGRRSFLCSGGHPTGEENVIFSAEIGRNRIIPHAVA